MKKLAVFLDRDGTINELSPGEYITSADRFRLIDGSKDALSILRRIADKLFVVTNQSNIGRNIITVSDLDDIHQKLEDETVKFDHIAYCPHKPTDDCYCRKPGTYLFEQIKLNFDISNHERIMIGDNKFDIQFGKNCGMKTILVRTGYGAGNEKECEPDLVFNNLLEAVLYLESMYCERV